MLPCKMVKQTAIAFLDKVVKLLDIFWIYGFHLSILCFCGYRSISCRSIAIYLFDSFGDDGLLCAENLLNHFSPCQFGRNEDSKLSAFANELVLAEFGNNF